MITTLEVVDETAHRQFCDLAVQNGLGLDSRFGGGYVQHELARVCHVLEEICPVADKHLLEFGCNIGATAIVAERLGAIVTGIDINLNMITLAHVNAARFGARHCSFVHVPDTRRLAFEDHSFDIVLCNSVLEYVQASHRPAVLSELDRVLRPTGLLVFHGTSNRLWPREVHSRSFLGNWVPIWLAPGTRRGVNPFGVRRAFAAYEDRLLGNRKAFVSIKTKQGMPRVTANVLSTAAAAMHVSAGMLLPSFILVLRKGHQH
jgi:ubiquinone/menaquinone biosynthesis C-methylase UbiE